MIRRIRHHLVMKGALDSVKLIYGGCTLKLVGTILQRGILILLLFCFPCWALFLNTEPILLFSGKTLKCTGFISLSTPSQIFAESVCPKPIDELCCSDMERGPAWANAISQYVQAILLFGYIVWRKLYVDTWGGWSTACFEDLGSFTRLAIPSMLMLCIEWWTFEIGIILSGILSVEDLGAQSIIYQYLPSSCRDVTIRAFTLQVPVGYSIAASVHIGHSLGAGDIAQAKKSMVVSLLMMGKCAVMAKMIVGTPGKVLAHLPIIISCMYVFSSRAIVKLVSNVLPVYAGCHLFDGCVATCGGILRGTGKQKIGAIFHTIGYYVICLPVAVSLMFAAKIGIISR
ncbi:multidrug and toxin extrusion protein 1-like [Pyxicephalus adspersus]|uniref:multidrug and toxin extrusion protein 1-like n=1 Tax=Pyxicephalus adspersus TaxID=30357 RepID=UPI003B5CA54F